MIYYITGGERSGKSRYAQDLALQLSDNPIYIATSRVWDKEFQQRINRHVSDRDNRWTTIEEEKQFSKVIQPKKVYVIDCVTLWLTNFFTDFKNDINITYAEAIKEVNLLTEIDTTLIIISNEIGMGIHAQNEVSRKFTELQGWVNQYIGSKADKATFMVSGLPLTLK